MVELQCVVYKTACFACKTINYCTYIEHTLRCIMWYFSYCNKLFLYIKHGTYRDNISCFDVPYIALYSLVTNLLQ